MASPVNNPLSPYLAGATFGTLQALAEARRANGGANGFTQPTQSATCPITPRAKVSEWITQQPSPFQNHSGGHQPIQGRHNLTQGHHNLAPESRTDNVSATAVINTNNTNTRLRGITHQGPRVKPSVPFSHASATLSSPLSILTFSSEPQSVVDGLKRKTFADGEDKESVYEPKSARSSISSRPGRAEKVIIDLTISDDEDDEPVKPAPTRDDDDDDLIFLGSRAAQTPALILGPNAAADYARPILPLPQRRRDCNGAQSPQAEGLPQQQNDSNQTIHSQENGFQQQNGSHQNHHRQTNGVHQNTAAAAAAAAASALPQQDSPNYPSTRSQAATAAAAAVAAHQEEDAHPETKTCSQVAAAAAAAVAATATEAAPQQESRYKFRTRRQYAAAATAAAAPYPPRRATRQTSAKERSRSISPAYMRDVFEEPAVLKEDGDDEKIEVVMDEIVVASPGGDGSWSTNKENVRIEGDEEDDDDDVRPHARKTPAAVTPAAVEHSPDVLNSATSPSSDQDSYSVIDSIDSSTELDSDIDIEFDDDDDYDGDDDDDEYLPRPTARKTPAATTHAIITIDSDSELSDIESTISDNDNENEEEASAPLPSIEPPPAGFFSLPRELRDKVYRHLLTTPQPIPVHFLWTKVVGRRITRRTRSRARANNNHTTATAGGSFSFFDSDNEDSDLDTRIDARVLRVCRQIAEEGLRVLYGENTFLYTLRDVAEVKKHVTRLANAQLQLQQQQQQQRQRRPSPRTRNGSAVQSPVSPSFPSAVSAAARDCDINLEKYGHLIRHMAIELDRNRTGDEYQELMCAALEAIVPEGYDKWEWGFSPSVFFPVQPKIRLNTLTITISPCVPRGLKQLLAEQDDEFGIHGTSTTANSNNNNHKDVRSKNAGGNNNDNRPIHPRLLAGLTVAKFFSPDSGVLRALQAVQTDFLRVNVHVNSDVAKDSVAGADIEREVDSDNEEADEEEEEEDDLDDFDEEDDDDDESFHDGSDDEADNHIQEEDEEEEEEEDDDDDEQEDPEEEDEESDPILYPPNLHPQHLETTLDLRYTPSRLAQLASQGNPHQHDPLIQTRRAALGAHFASTLANLRRHIEDACLRPWWSVRRGRITGIGAFGMGGSSVGAVQCGGMIDDGRFGNVTPTLGVGGGGSGSGRGGGGGGGGGYGVWEEHAAAEVRRRNQRVDIKWVFDRDAYDDLRLEEFMREMEEAREEGEELPGTEEERWMDRGGKSLVVTFFRDKKDKVLKAIRI